MTLRVVRGEPPAADVYIAEINGTQSVPPVGYTWQLWWSNALGSCLQNAGSYIEAATEQLGATGQYSTFSRPGSGSCRTSQLRLVNSGTGEYTVSPLVFEEY